MDILKLSQIWDTRLFCEVSCDRCQKKPAIKLMADCQGDAMSLCKEHWIEWFNQVLLPAFDEPPSPHYIQVDPPEKYKNIGPVYEYKN